MFLGTRFHRANAISRLEERYSRILRAFPLETTCISREYISNLLEQNRHSRESFFFFFIIFLDNQKFRAKLNG